MNGKIVSCSRENIKSVAEGQEALSAGAKGMIVSNQPQQGTTNEAEPHVFSAVGRPNRHPPPKTDATPPPPLATEFQIVDA